MGGERLIEEIARYAADKKAVEVVELDLRGVLGYTDYFLVCSGARAARRRRSTTASSRASSTSTSCYPAASRGRPAAAGS